MAKKQKMSPGPTQPYPKGARKLGKPVGYNGSDPAPIYGTKVNPRTGETGRKGKK